MLTRELHGNLRVVRVAVQALLLLHTAATRHSQFLCLQPAANHVRLVPQHVMLIHQLLLQGLPSQQHEQQRQ